MDVLVTMADIKAVTELSASPWWSGLLKWRETALVIADSIVSKTTCLLCTAVHSQSVIMWVLACAGVYWRLLMYRLKHESFPRIFVSSHSLCAQLTNITST